ncbi:flagellar biosynthetic protein FliR [Oryzihumus sp.]|jgi:flagellar biosynthetic protein FliR|uniref:flagellar biosynthetic protein FliR n=1 Tax=Oryzihumus sp. TaxID=1968903 RepID=UPI002ED78254
MDFAVPTATLLAVLLATVRASAWLAVAPPFNTRAIPTTVKVALAFALALPVGPRLSGQAPPLELFPLIGAVLFQVAVGLTLGFLAQLLFSAVQAAGELIDLASGFTVASLYDPLSNVTSSMFGRVQQLLAVTLLFATGGHLLLIRGFLTSFEVLPLRVVSIGALAGTVTNNVGRFFVAALEIAAPVVVVLFLAELALGLVSRAVPSLNVLAMSFPLKILLTLSVAGVAIGLLPGAVSALLDRITTDVAAALRILGAA